MHWTGKLCAWLLIPLILLAMAWSAKLVKVRNSWTAKIEKAKKEYADLAPKVAEARAALRRAQGDFHRATQSWGEAEPAETVVQNPANGTLTADLDPRKIKEQQWVYGFEVKPDGTTVYRGDFIVSSVRDKASVLQPNWQLRQGDTADWKSGKWRFRAFLPASFPNRADGLQQTLLLQEELLLDREQTLATQEELIASATEQLKLREAELVGGPELPQEESLDLEFRQGLTAALEELEESRNAELVAIDRLRRSVRSLQQRIEATQSENRELARKLPQPAAEVSRKP